ncbi:MAG TPA: hypothetical protein VMV56_07910 [Williamwhitmania sp.]|nr:hypothetical protein [Williamwhitmania sp.]
MKKIIFTLLALTVVSLAWAKPNTNYKNKQLTLFSYVVTIDPSVYTYLDPYKDLFEKDDKVDPIEKAVRNDAFSQLEQRLEQEIGMDIQPLESFQDRISYDKFGYPDGNISKVIRIGSSKFYFKIAITITAVEPRNDPYNSARQINKDKKETTDTITEESEPGFRPNVTIVMTIFNNKGIIPVDKFQGMAKAKNILPTDATLLDGIANNDAFEGKDNLMGLINEAITDLIINMTH